MMLYGFTKSRLVLWVELWVELKLRGKMSRQLHKLSPMMVRKETKAGRYSDGGGLYLQVSPTQTKSWLFRYMLNGKAHQMGLGSINTIAMDEARVRAQECRKLLIDGIDPIEVNRSQKQQAEIEQARAMSFEECAKLYIAAHRDSWKNAKHAYQWSSSLENYVYPYVKNLPITAFDTALVMKCLEPIWRVKTETATRVRGRIERVIDWAKARHYYEGENPARWRGHLQNLLPSPSKIHKVSHLPALPYKQVPSFMAKLRNKKTTAAYALQFTVLAGVRTSETLLAEWSEVDLQKKLWTIPPERTKNGEKHTVPLSSLMISILKEMKRIKQSEFVFAGKQIGKPLSNQAMLMIVRRMDVGKFVVHGFRSTIRDWMSETRDYPHEVKEKVLGHKIANRVEAAYRRGELVEKRAIVMQDWANYCLSSNEKEAL